MEPSGPPGTAAVPGMGAVPVGLPEAAAVPGVPLQQVSDAELSRHWMFLIADGIAPHHQYLICTFQGHVLCQQRCESKHGAVPGLALLSEVSARGGSVPAPGAACAGTQDTSHHNLERMKCVPGQQLR